MKVNSMIPTRAPHVRRLAQALLLVSATAASAAGPMDQEATVDGYTVRWNAAVTGFLPRSVVEKHHLASMGRGVLNVVVLQPAKDGKPGDTIRADVSVTAYNLAGQLLTIDMRPVTANGRTSYLGTFDVHHGDQLDFTIRVQPPRMERPFTVDFERRFLLRGDDESEPLAAP